MNLRDGIITLLSYIRQPQKRKLIRIARDFTDLTGIEIGGPSSFFSLKGGLPVYLFAKRVDGVNFSTNTIWEGTIQGGETYGYYDKKIGTQYIAEATNLSQVKNGAYDFVLSCHSLEHVANPLKAVIEWKRVSKSKGRLILVLPDKDFTFDYKRPYTSFSHILSDYNSGLDEYDATHFEEIMQYHDVSKDPGLKSMQELQSALSNNYSSRTAHHHVFSQEMVKEMLEYCGYHIIHQQKMAPFHLITVAELSA